MFEVDVKNMTERNGKEGTRLGFLCGCEILENRGKGIFGTLCIFSNHLFWLFNFVVPLCHLEDMIFYY